MPAVDREGTTLHYDVRGSGPTVAFVGDVGAGAWLWGWQQPALTGPYETLVWDYRGTGHSDPPAGPLAVETLANDLETILSDHAVADVHLVGAGLGGMVALQYAHAYGRADSLTLMGTAARYDSVTDRLTTLRASPDDPEALRASLDSAFGADLTQHPDLLDSIVEWRQSDDADLDSWDAQAAAMRTFEAPQLYEITLPALVMHGVDDVVVPQSAGESLARDLPRGEYQAVEGGHWFFLEESAAVSDAFVAWLNEQTAEE